MPSFVSIIVSIFALLLANCVFVTNIPFQNNKQKVQKMRQNKRKPGILCKYRVFLMAEQEGFEPSVPFWGTHDFQSCPL